MNRWWVRILRYALPYRGSLAVILVLVLAGAIVEALKPWPLKLIIDHVLAGRPLPPAAGWLGTLPGAGTALGQLGWLTGGTVLLFVARWGARMVQAYFQAGAGTRMLYDLGADLFEHIQRLSIALHARLRAGDLTQRVTSDTACVRDLAVSVLLPLLTSAVSLAAMFVVMWRLNPILAGVALLAAVPLYAVIRLFMSRLKESAYEQYRLQGQVMAMAEQTLTALPMVQAFGGEPEQDRHFSALTRRSARAQLRTTLSKAEFVASANCCTAAGVALVMGLGGMYVLGGHGTLGDLLVFLSYLSSLYAPLESLAQLSSGFASAAAGAERVLEVFELDPGLPELAAPTILPPARGHLSFQNVTFGYQPNEPVLRDVSFEAAPGETIAVVGPSGAGKSTLLSLIPRLTDPWDGAVSLDGFDLRRLPLPSVRSSVSAVLQDVLLLPISVADNIAYGRPEATREQIVQAAIAARAHDFIRALPDGYDTVLGERGATLSGGERQRIAIARAFLRNAPVLLLDEPTSALDAESEALVMQAVQQLIQGRTTFIIAHRLSTVHHASRILVLEDGRVVESGTHQQLMARRGRYRCYYDLGNKK